MELGCVTRTDADGSLVVVVDAAQRTSVPGVYAAGETTGVGGAELALVEGELAGLAGSPHAGCRSVARQRRLGRRRAPAAGVRRRPARGRTPVPDELAAGPDTLVCRCEEVPVRDGWRRPYATSAPPTSGRPSWSPGRGWAGARAGSVQPPHWN